MRKYSRYLPFVAVFAAILAVSIASAASTVKITNCSTAVSRPKQVTLTCADANTRLNKLVWSSYGGATAKAKGTFETNTCEPNCAAGKTVKYPVAVTAGAQRSCPKPKGLRVYNKLTLQFTGKSPKGASKLKSWTLGCPT